MILESCGNSARTCQHLIANEHALQSQSNHAFVLDVTSQTPGDCKTHKACHQEICLVMLNIKRMEREWFDVDVVAISVGIHVVVIDVGKTPTPTQATNARSDVSGTHNHQVDNWNNHN